MLARASFRCGVAATLAAVFACVWGLPLHAQGITAFVDVSVVRLDSASVLPGQTVVVEGGRIVEIGPRAATEIPPRALSVDGRGRYLLPGLIHLHGQIPAPGEVRPEDVLLLYLARGVTTLRAPDPHESHEDLRRDLDRGRLAGPRLVLTASDSTRATRTVADELIERLLPGVPLYGLEHSQPIVVLRAATTDATAELDLGDVGGIRRGARADLILLDGNPLEGLEPLRSPAGVMAAGRWRSRAQLEREVERRARELVLDYGRLLSRTDLPASCTGTTLHDCFGGEQRCAAGNGCSRAHLAAERALLLARLDLLSSIFPTNDWMTGQRVNSAVEHALVSRATVIAEACKGTLWWCQALRGYTLHLTGDAAAAELRFDSAIASAPEGQLAWVRPGDAGFDDRTLQCEWNDLRYLIDGSLLSEYRAQPCGENHDFEARFWWLSDPLWSVPGNQRRAEHLSRIVQMRLHDDQGDERGAHVQRHHWEVMPVGVPNSWRSVMREVRGQNEDRRELYVNGGYSFTPDERRFTAPTETTSEEWTVELGEGDERMITRETWHNLDHQDVLLRREGRLLFLAAARPPRLLPTYDSVHATLALGRPTDRQVELLPAAIGDVGVVRARAELADAGRLVSLEVVGEGWVGRTRHGLRPPALTDGFGLSEPVLVDERLESGMPLTEAMLPSTELGGRSQVGLYFEVYGASRNEPLRVGVSAERTNRSLFRRLTGALRLTTDASLSVNWQEAAEVTPEDVMTRYLTVDVSGLDEGDYRLTVLVERASGVVATSSRSVRIER